jgi:hypothetical protein
MKFIGVAIVWLEGSAGEEWWRGGGAYTSGEGVGLAASWGILVDILRHWEEILTLCHSVLDVIHGVKASPYGMRCAFRNVLTRASEFN